MQAYYNMQGLGNGFNGDGTPYRDPITNKVTPFLYPGDPLTGSGWINSMDFPPRGREFQTNSGPCRFDPGSSQQVVIALVVGQGTDRLNSVKRLKQTALAAKAFIKQKPVLAVLDSYDEPGQASVRIPIYFSHPGDAVSHLEYDLVYPPQALSTVTVEEHDVDQQVVSPGRLRIKYNGGPLLPGSGVLMNLAATLATGATSSIGIAIENIVCKPPDGFGLTVAAISGQIITNHAPSKVHLLTPSNNTLLDRLNYTFSWTASRDLDLDTLLYQVYFGDTKTPIFITTDTVWSANISRLIKPDSVFRWTVAVNDRRTPYLQASSDTLNFKVTSLLPWDFLQTANQVSLEGYSGDVAEFQISDERLYLRERGYINRISVYGLEKPTEPRWMGQVEFQPFFGLTAVGLVSSGIGYFVNSFKLYVYDFRNPENIKLLRTINLYSEFYRIVIHDHFLVLFGAEYKVIIMDATDPLNPYILSRQTLHVSYDSRCKSDFQIQGQLALAAGMTENSDSAALDIYQWQDASPWTRLSRIVPWNNVLQWLFADSHLYVVQEITNPASGAIPLQGGYHSHELSIYDLSAPTQPQKISGLLLPGSSTSNLKLHHGFLFIGAGKIDIIDVRDPFHPVQIGFNHKIQQGLAAQGPYVYAMMDNKLTTLCWPSNVAVDAVHSSPMKNTLFQNYPNPFNHTTTISYQVVEPVPVWIGIYNVLGQVVRYWHPALQTPGLQQLHWDGKTELGAVSPAGIYFLRVKMGKEEMIKKMLLLP